MNKILLFLISILFLSCQEPTLLVDDGSAIKGCTDPNSVNFNSKASINDGSCVYIDTLQNSIFGKFTATWCVPCGEWGFSTFQGLYNTNKGRALAISLQVSDALTNGQNGPLVDEFSSKWQYSGTPNFFVNDNFVGTGASGINGQISTKNSGMPKLSIGKHITEGAGKNAGKLNVNVYIKSFDDISGIYTMSVLYLYKEISGPQKVGSTTDPNFVHHHVLAASAIDAGAFGEEIFTNLSNGEVFHWSKTIDYNQNWNMSKMEMVFIVWKKTPTGYEFVNCTTN